MSADNDNRLSLGQALFEPRGIALIGAADNPKKNNGRAQKYLKAHGFPGAVYPVNPRRDEVYGERCYASVTDIEGPVDHAFITTPAPTVPALIRACGEKGVTVATVFTADFAETGAEGKALQDELLTAGREANVRIIGPNCMGVYNTNPPAPITPNTIMQLPELTKGNIGVVSHSGSLTGTFISRGQHRGLGFSKIVSIGNESDISVAEVGEILIDDPKTEIILLFMETIRHHSAFSAMARRAYSVGKPIVIFKLGRSKAAQEFTASHTGAIAGTDAAVDAFLRSLGIARVQMFETLFEAPMLFAGRKPRPGNRIAIATTTGGGGGMAADCLGLAGLEPTPLPEADEKALHADDIPISNGPVIDLTFKAATGENTKKVLTAMLNADNNDAALMVAGSSAQFNPEIAVKPLLDLAGHEKPIGAFLVPQADESNRLLSQARIAAFRSPESCADAFRAFLNWRAPVEPVLQPFDETAVKATLTGKRKGALDENASRLVFEALGVPQAASIVVTSPDDARSKAKEMSFPVVAKVVSADVPHKTEAGGVVLNIADIDALAEAIETIRKRVTKAKPDANIEGYLVQTMEKGLSEVLVGYRIDPLVGPTVVLAAGGVLSEIYGDAAIRIAPVDKTIAHGMIEDVKGLAPIRGYRGLPKGDLDALADTIVALSNLARLDGFAIEDAEINPVLVKGEGQGVIAVDGLVILGA